MIYFFNIRDAAGLIEDEEGSELSGFGAAQEEARDSARDLMIDYLRGGPTVVGRQIEITDINGGLLEVLSLSSVVPYH